VNASANLRSNDGSEFGRIVDRWARISRTDRSSSGIAANRIGRHRSRGENPSVVTMVLMAKRTMHIGLFFLLVFVASTAASANEFGNLPQVKEIANGQPEEVTAFIERVVECNHSDGEEPYDKERAEQIRGPETGPRRAVATKQVVHIPDLQQNPIHSWPRSSISPPPARFSLYRC
jgi:hypothetical protein